MKKLLEQLLKYLHKNRLVLFFLVIIFLIAAFLRFYNFPLRYGLGDETVREAVIGIEGARQLQAPLTGGFSSAGPFTWGPWFYYQMIVVSILFPYQYSPFIYLTITSIICVFLLHQIGSLLYGKKFGLLLAALGAISPALILSSTHLTFPNLTNVFALLSFLIFIKLVQKNISCWWSFALGITLGIAINIHYQMAGLLVLPVLILMAKPKKYLYFLITSIGIAITFIPLFLFDLTNHWHNLKNIIYYYTEGKKAIYVPNRWLFYLRDFWPAFWSNLIGTPIILTWIIMVAAFFSIALQLVRKQLKKEMVLILVAFIINFLFLRYYWGERFFGYLNHMRPFVFIFTGLALYFPLSVLLTQKYRYVKYISFVFSVIIFISILPKTIQELPPDSFSLELYNATKLLENAYPGEKFSVYNCEYKGNTRYSAVSHTLVFLLDMKEKLDDKGIKIGVKGNDCEFPKSQKSNTLSLEKTYPNITNTLFFNLSKASEKELQKAGWKRDSFKIIYDSTARWWFKEQP